RAPTARRPRERAEQVDLSMERVEVAGHGAVLERRRVEAAVPAPLRAERHVHIQSYLPRLRRRRRKNGGRRRRPIVRHMNMHFWICGAGSHLSQATLGESDLMDPATTT